MVCAGCGVYGHAVCLCVERLQDYLFCSQCMVFAQQQYQAMINEQQIVERRRGVVGQLEVWKGRAMEAVQVSTSIGIAVGGTAATVAGAAVAAASGIARGAQSVITAGRNVPLPPIPDSSAVEANTLRRASSTFFCMRQRLFFVQDVT